MASAPAARAAAISCPASRYPLRPSRRTRASASADVRGGGVRIGVDGDGADAEPPAGGEHPPGDLAAIGDQMNHGSLSALRASSAASAPHRAHIRKTPKFDVPLIGPLAMADKHIPSTVRVSRGSMTPSSYSHPGQHHRQRLGLDLRLDRRPHCGVGILVHLLAAGLGRSAADDRQHARELRAAHDRGLRARPGEQEARIVGASAHAVVTRAVGGADQQRDVRDGRVRHGVDHHRAVLDHPAFLVLLADHVAGGVVQEQQWRVGSVGQLDELRGLLRLLGEQHAAVRWPGCRSDSRTAWPKPVTSDEPYSALNSSKSEPSTMRAMTSRGSNGIRRSDGNDADQFFGVEQRLGDRARCRSLFAPVEPGDDAAADPDGVELVDGEVVRQTRSAGVHFGAAQRFVVGLLAGGHLHQRRARPGTPSSVP